MTQQEQFLLMLETSRQAYKVKERKGDVVVTVNPDTERELCAYFLIENGNLILIVP